MGHASVRGDFLAAGVIVLVMCVEGEEPPKSGLKRSGVRYSRTFLLRAHECLWLRLVGVDPKWCAPLGTLRNQVICALVYLYDE
jgi:hypothetical protein